MRRVQQGPFSPLFPRRCSRLQSLDLCGLRLFELSIPAFRAPNSHVYTPVGPSEDGGRILNFRRIVGVHDHETPIRSAGTGCCAAARGWAGKS